jgi:hypothetical protein
MARYSTVKRNYLALFNETTEKTMSLVTDRKCTRISSANLKKITAEGVKRALAARKTAGIEVSSEQMNQIGGGFSPFVRPDAPVFLPVDGNNKKIAWAGGPLPYPPMLPKDTFEII